jgi:hypothetical protein
MSRGTVLNYTERLVVEDCCQCGVHFALPEDLRARCLKDHSKSFFCPNGHSMTYTGKTDEAKAKEAQVRAEREAAHLRARLDQAEAETAQTKNSLRATKAAATRARNRIEKGVCPHPKCHRHFENVQRHIARCHPDFAEAHLVEVSK